MSRYTASTDRYLYAWGFDEPMGTYYFQKFNLHPRENEEECIYSIDSYYTTIPHPDFPRKVTYKRSEILGIMEDEMEENDFVIPEDHLNAIVLDLTF